MTLIYPPEPEDREFDIPLCPRVVDYGSFIWNEAIGRLVVFDEEATFIRLDEPVLPRTASDDLDPESKALRAWEVE